MRALIRRHLPKLVFLLALGPGLAMTWAMHISGERRLLVEFERAADLAVDRVVARLEQHVVVLRAARGLLSVTRGDLSRDEFLRFLDSIDLAGDLSGVQGSGPNGRFVRRDVEAAAEKKPAAPVFARAVAGVRQAPTSLPVTTMRKVIAQRLTEVKPGVPHFYLTVELEMEQALKLREEAKAKDLKISVNDIIVKAVGVAVRRFPRINQVFAGDSIQQLQNVDVGVAVAIEDGLITPIVKDADQKGLAEIAAEVRDLAERAKKKALKPDEYTGGSITVSNLGMFGIDSFIAVINPPQASILAVGKVEPKVVVRDGQMVIRQMMSMTFSGDHRVVDGAVGAQFLQVVRELIEHPMRLLF